MANKKSKDKARDKPATRQYVYHAIALVIGIVLLFVICFAKELPGGMRLGTTGKMIAIVLVILIVGTYLRRFSLTKPD